MHNQTTTSQPAYSVTIELENGHPIIKHALTNTSDRTIEMLDCFFPWFAPKREYFGIVLMNDLQFYCGHRLLGHQRFSDETIPAGQSIHYEQLLDEVIPINRHPKENWLLVWHVPVFANSKEPPIWQTGSAAWYQHDGRGVNMEELLKEPWVQQMMNFGKSLGEAGNRPRGES